MTWVSARLIAAPENKFPVCIRCNQLYAPGGWWTSSLHLGDASAPCLLCTNPTQAGIITAQSLEEVRCRVGIAT